MPSWNTSSSRGCFRRRLPWICLPTILLFSSLTAGMDGRTRTKRRHYKIFATVRVSCSTHALRSLHVCSPIRLSCVGADVRERYVWLKLLFVPAACTDLVQPADRGMISWLKAFMRKIFSDNISADVLRQLQAGTPPADIRERAALLARSIGIGIPSAPIYISSFKPALSEFK